MQRMFTLLFWALKMGWCCWNVRSNVQLDVVSCLCRQRMTSSRSHSGHFSVNVLKAAFWPLLLQIGVGGDHRAAHAGADVRQLADGWVCMGPPTRCSHQADRWQPVVGAIRPQHLTLLLLQRLHPAYSVAQAPGLRHHPPGQVADSEAAHRCHQPPSCKWRRRRESVSWQQPRAQQRGQPRGKHVILPRPGAVWKTGQQRGGRQVRLLLSRNIKGHSTEFTYESVFTDVLVCENSCIKPEESMQSAVTWGNLMQSPGFDKEKKQHGMKKIISLILLIISKCSWGT